MTGIWGRLAHLFSNFAENWEFPHKVDPDGLGAVIGIPDDDRTLTTEYIFRPSDDGYEVGTVLGQVDEHHVSEFAVKLLRTEPSAGITERVGEDGTVVIYSSRDGLSNFSDQEVQYCFMDDIARTSESSNRYKELMEEITIE